MFRFKKIVKILFVVLLVLLINFQLVKADNKVNINTATQTQLESLTGIGSTKAKAIIDYRETNGNFKTIEDIMQVKGIGQATFDKIKDDITVDEETQNPAGDQIVINELLPNPVGDDSQEWIELKNIGKQTANLEGWKINDQSKSYVLTSTDGPVTILPNDFLLISRTRSKLVLNNSGGETISLFDPADKLVSQTGYSGTVEEETSWARDENGDYQWTKQLTPGAENVWTETTNEARQDENKAGAAVENKRQSIYKDKVIFNEIFPNPVGLDDNEWLEIYNKSSEAISLTGWQIKSSHKQYKFKGQIIKAGGYLVLTRQIVGWHLLNLGGDSLELVDRQGWPVDKVAYKTIPPEGQSYNWCADDNKWLWLDKLTPGQVNACPIKNELPIAYFESSRLVVKPYEYFVLDASESYDSDGELVNYQWEFNPAVNIMGERAKKFVFHQPRVTVENLTMGQQEVILKIIDNLGGQDEYKLILNQLEKPAIKTVYINKFLPNPKGDDRAGEWIELCSSADEDINLQGYSLDDDVGGSPAKNLSNYNLPAQGCISLSRLESGLDLNNIQDKVRLLYKGKVIDEASYRRAKENTVFVKKVNNWQPLENNPSSSIVTDKKNYYFELNNLNSLNSLSVGSLVGVVGQVTTEPGLLGANVFYLADQTAGAQIYNYQKDFPALALGDLIHVRGKFYLVNNMKRIKINSHKDIDFIKHEQPLSPQRVQLDELGEENQASLVKVQGELTEIKGRSWWLDDGTDEIKVYFKVGTQINKHFQVGDRLVVTGILDKYKGEFRLMPREQSDIELVGKVLGQNDYQPVAEKKKNSDPLDNNVLIKYLLAVMSAAIIILIGLIIKFKIKFIKKYKETKNDIKSN